MKHWSWWRVFLPLWVILGHNVIYLLVGFLCLFAVCYGEDEGAQEPARVQSDRIAYQVASLVCDSDFNGQLVEMARARRKLLLVLALLGSAAMVVLFGILALVSQFFD